MQSAILGQDHTKKSCKAIAYSLASSLITYFHCRRITSSIPNILSTHFSSLYIHLQQLLTGVVCVKTMDCHETTRYNTSVKISLSLDTAGGDVLTLSTSRTHFPGSDMAVSGGINTKLRMTTNSIPLSLADTNNSLVTAAIVKKAVDVTTSASYTSLCKSTSCMPSLGGREHKILTIIQLCIQI